MTHARQVVMIARACFCTISTHTFIAICYATYLVCLATVGLEAGGNMTPLHLCFAPAIAGAWVGVCVGRAAGWTGSRFAPTFVPSIGLVSSFAAVSTLGLIGLIAWIGDLDPLPYTALGVLLMAAGVAGGCTRPSLTTHLLVGLAISSPFAPLLGATMPLPVVGAAGATTSIIALAGGTVLFVRIAFRLRATGVASHSATAPWQPPRVFRNRLSEPSIGQVAVWSGVLAAGCTFAHRLPTFEWRDIPLIVVIGSLFANLTATGTSVVLPRGPLPGTAWLLLSGIANSRADAGRRMLWRVVADSAFAAGVFAAVAVALGPDWHLVEMMLVALAACHAYLATACGSRWLMSSRLSALVATPVVVAIAGVVWVSGPWGLPSAIAAFLLSAVATVYVGGLGIARVDLDLAPYPEPAR